MSMVLMRNEIGYQFHIDNWFDGNQEQTKRIVWNSDEVTSFPFFPDFELATASENVGYPEFDVDSFMTDAAKRHGNGISFAS